MASEIELVRTHYFGQPERITVCELGEISAPADLDGMGLNLTTAQRILCDVQHPVVTVQERALKAKAALMRQVDPTQSLNDYRRRWLQTLYGTLVTRIPTLVRRGSRFAPPSLFRNSARSNTEYDELRSRLGAFMSYRMAGRLVGDLFPFAVGRASNTTRRQVLRRATHFDADLAAVPCLIVRQRSRLILVSIRHSSEATRRRARGSMRY